MDSRCVGHSPLAASPAGASAKEAILSGVSSLDASVRMTASVSSRSLVVWEGPATNSGKDLRIRMRKQSHEWYLRRSWVHKQASGKTRLHI